MKTLKNIKAEILWLVWNNFCFVTIISVPKDSIIPGILCSIANVFILYCLICLDEKEKEIK